LELASWSAPAFRRENAGAQQPYNDNEGVPAGVKELETKTIADSRKALAAGKPRMGGRPERANIANR